MVHLTEKPTNGDFTPIFYYYLRFIGGGLLVRDRKQEGGKQTQQSQDVRRQKKSPQKLVRVPPSWSSSAQEGGLVYQLPH